MGMNTLFFFQFFCKTLPILWIFRLSLLGISLKSFYSDADTSPIFQSAKNLLLTKLQSDWVRSHSVTSPLMFRLTVRLFVRLISLSFSCANLNLMRVAASELSNFTCQESVNCDSGMALVALGVSCDPLTREMLPLDVLKKGMSMLENCDDIMIKTSGAVMRGTFSLNIFGYVLYVSLIFSAFHIDRYEHITEQSVQFFLDLLESTQRYGFMAGFQYMSSSFLFNSF